MAQIPDSSEYRERWAKLDREARRRITRGVNFVHALDDPREAAMAARLAMAQQRFWKRTWPLGAVLVTLLQMGQGVVAMVVNGLISLAMFGAMALFFLRRARRAEAVNREVAERRGKSSRKKGRKG